MSSAKRWILLLLAFVVIAASGLWLVTRHGFSAREEPWAIEAFFARNVRLLATPSDARLRQNPLPLDAESLSEGMHHFADHCASCHGNDGRGKVTLGQNLYPKAPDMTAAATQELSDGEIYYIIANGIRFTGMPAWGDAHGEDNETWGLVHFIRHLPKLSDLELAEMEGLNPRSPSQWAEEDARRRFLLGDDEPPPGSSEPAPHHH